MLSTPTISLIFLKPSLFILSTNPLVYLTYKLWTFKYHSCNKFYEASTVTHSPCTHRLPRKLHPQKQKRIYCQLFYTYAKVNSRLLEKLIFQTIPRVEASHLSHHLDLCFLLGLNKQFHLPDAFPVISRNLSTST
jgi:hypothetical protein